MAVSKQNKSLKYASTKLKNNYNIVLTAVKKDKHNLKICF